MDEVFRGRTVLITGAGGLDRFRARPTGPGGGSEVGSSCWTAPRAPCSISIDSCARRYGDSGVEIVPRLGNVASRNAIARLIAAERPDVILHAAAYKHVPMMEQHPSDAVHVNIGGTAALLDAAVEAGVERFVLVSTDKAVKPSSVMGASKRVAEMLVADTARRTGRAYVSVRFGNVLGSNGSVVPIFQDQLERGLPADHHRPRDDPLLHDHPGGRRGSSWMPPRSVSEGDLFVLDMGEPIKVMDLARDVVRLAGRDPDTQPIRLHRPATRREAP